MCMCMHVCREHNLQEAVFLPPCVFWALKSGWWSGLRAGWVGLLALLIFEVPFSREETSFNVISMKCKTTTEQVKSVKMHIYFINFLHWEPCLSLVEKWVQLGDIRTTEGWVWGFCSFKNHLTSFLWGGLFGQFEKNRDIEFFPLKVIVFPMCYMKEREQYVHSLLGTTPRCALPSGFVLLWGASNPVVSSVPVTVSQMDLTLVPATGVFEESL